MKPSWDQLSAYIDGELPADEAAAVAAAIAADADLAAQVATLTRLKARTAEAASAWDLPASPPPALAVGLGGRNWRPAMIAASLAMAVALGVMAFILPLQDRQAEPALPLQAAIELHRNWIAAPAAGMQADHVAAAALAEIPDLTAAGLTLSHIAMSGAQRQDVMFGFRGPRGCRVSLWVGNTLQDFTTVPTRREFDGLTGFVWRVEHRGYALLTRDMNPQRFATLASAVARITREQFRVDALTRMALRQSADPALPCPA